MKNESLVEKEINDRYCIKSLEVFNSHTVTIFTK